MYICIPIHHFHPSYTSLRTFIHTYIPNPNSKSVCDMIRQRKKKKKVKRGRRGGEDVISSSTAVELLSPRSQLLASLTSSKKNHPVSHDKKIPDTEEKGRKGGRKKEIHRVPCSKYRRAGESGGGGRREGRREGEREGERRR